jgi:beta-xylosidase
MTLSEIQIRDPFVLPVKEESAYYLFGTTDKNAWSGPVTGFDCYRSRDLVHWEGPTAAFRRKPDFWAKTQFWAPEVHFFNGRFFMLATFKAENRYRGTQVLVADRPAGPYEPWSVGPVTPPYWECLDGTLHVDGEGNPWMVFCHEWVQVHNGAVYAIRLSPDLKQATGRPVFLFNASEARWARSLEPSNKDKTSLPAYVTDGPFLHRTSKGALLMLWSSMGAEGYAMGIARSANGAIDGLWIQQPEPLWSRDGGHGMLFRAFDGRLFLTLHQPNNTPHERAIFREVEEQGDSIRLKSA